MGFILPRIGVGVYRAGDSRSSWVCVYTSGILATLGTGSY
jgi:hypothetical protein